MLANSKLDQFRKLLVDNALIVTPNNIMGVILYVHPYQADNIEVAIGRAILARDLRSLTQLLDDGSAELDTSIYLADWMGFTPLVIAVQVGELEMVKALLAAGADPNAASVNLGAKPLQVATIVTNEPNADVLRAAGAR